MEYIKDFIMTIITAIVFITAVEIIAPDKPIKKYIKFVMGLILIVIILNPIVYLFTSSEDSILNSLSNLINNNSLYSQEEKSEVVNKEKEKSIQENLNKNCKAELEKEFKDLKFNPEIECSFDFEKMEYSINKIDIAVEDKSINIIKKIEISLNSNKSEQAIATEELDKAEEIKLYLSDLLGVSSEKINLYKAGGA